MLGLVLEGGGVKGAYHIGAYTALTEEGYKFDGYAGTSIGAINAAMLAQGDWRKTLSMWDNVSLMSMLALPDKNDVSRDPNGKNAIFGMGKSLVKLSSTITRSTEQLHSFLEQYIDEEAIRASDKDFGLCTYSVPDFTAHYLMKEDIPESQLCDYVIASASYPLFRWYRISGTGRKKFIDGGVYDNMPVKLLVDKGYKKLFVIRTRSKKAKRQIDEKGLDITYIVPHEKLAYALEFTQENVRKYKKMGYFDAKRVLFGLPSKVYCVRCNGVDDFGRFISSLKPDTLADALRFLGITPKSFTNANVGELCDVIRYELELERKTDDYKAFIYFLETLAACFSVEKFKFYNLADFYAAVMEGGRAYAFAAGKNIETFLKKDVPLKINLKKIFVGLYKNYTFADK